MIRALSLDGFRGFNSFKVPNLKRVNLLVGMNNCGKSSVLEAVDFLTSKGNPFVLVRPLQRRGEKNLGDPDAFPVIEHLFFGHPVLRPGTNLRISADDNVEPLTVEIVELEDALEDAVKQKTLFEHDIASSILDIGDDPIPSLGLRIRRGNSFEFPIVPISDDGSVSLQFPVRLRRMLSESFIGNPPSMFLTPDSLYPRSMSEMWDKAIAGSRESDVVDAMKILRADIESIHFLTRTVSRTTMDGVLLGFKDAGRRLPLGSFGDGMRRLLALSLALVRTSGGYLLIDEIDTGLHFSVMEKMWKLVINTAQKSNIQVFATTHSSDCITGLASLVETQPDFASEVSIQKIESTLTKAVSLDAEQIQLAVRQNIEIR